MQGPGGQDVPLAAGQEELEVQNTTPGIMSPTDHQIPWKYYSDPYEHVSLPFNP